MGLQTLESVRRTTLRLRTTGDSDRMESGYQMVRDHILTWEARRKALEAFAVERSDEAPTTLAAIKKRGKAAVRAEQLQKRRKFHNAGWPKSWSLRRIEDWRSHGRGIAQAQEFARAGWRARMAKDRPPAMVMCRTRRPRHRARTSAARLATPCWGSSGAIGRHHHRPLRSLPAGPPLMC